MRKLDRTDIGILNALQENARITNADLARSVNLSPTPCFNRVKAMEELGLIREQVTLLDADLLGLHVNVFIHVSLEKQNELALQQFESAIADRPEVMECYLMAGDPDYLIRVLVPTIQALERFMMDFLTKVPGVANIRSSLALKQVRYKTALPLPSNGISLGARVLHPKFGEGTILHFEGQGPNARLQINFDGAGTKWLVSQYARLEVI